MWKLTRLLSAGGAALLLLAGSAGVARADADRPFKGTVVGESTFASVGLDVCPATYPLWGDLQTQGAGSGQFSHLGLTTISSSHCTVQVADFTGGETVFTAANGDELYATYHGTQLELPFPLGTVPEGDTFPVIATYEITGGSGRFDGATGEGTITASVLFEGFDDPTWATTWVFEGTLAY